MKTTTKLDEVRRDPYRFTWGPVKHIHDVGPRYTIVEFGETFQGEPTGKVGFYTYIDGVPSHTSFSSFDEALIGCVAVANLEVNTARYATQFAMRALTR